MMDGTEEQRDKIIRNLELLNEKVSRQMSVRFIVYTGILYGLGFVIGSSVVAAFLLGLVGPIVVRMFPSLLKLLEIGWRVTGA